MIEKLKRNKVTRKLLIMMLSVLSFINKIIPKDPKKILFYDSARDFLDDNTEALYSWMLSRGYDKDYKLICCVPRETASLEFSNYKPIGALKGLLAFLTSKYVFFSFGDFRIRPSKSQVVVNQWHGSPLKRIGKLTYDESYQNERLDNFTYLLAASEFFKPFMAQAFGCQEKRVLVVGNARNDYLFSDKKALELVGIDKNKYSKTILWMPTFRKSVDNRFTDGNTSESQTMLPVLENYEQLDRFDELLGRLGVLLVIKIHPMAVFKANNYKNIITMTNNDIIPKGVRLYEFVKEFDSLITDYSSILCDYLLLDRPMAFTLDDYDQYQGSRGFVVDNLKEYLPGHHIYCADDMFKFVEDLSENIDDYHSQRLKMCRLFNETENEGNCRKLLKEIGIKVNDVMGHLQ